MDDIWHVWNDLQRKEDDLKWGGHLPGIGAQYDSMGRPSGCQVNGGGGPMHEQMGRVERVRRALQDSGAPAHSMIAHTLAGIDLSPVWQVLVSACQDTALCYGSSVANGGFIGGAGGRFFGGVGIFPGGASGAAVGNPTQGGWVMALLGVPSLGEGLNHSMSEAAHYYAMGFIEAWGPKRQGNGVGYASNARGDPSVAAFHIGHGHLIMIAAILAALAAYLVKNKDGRAALLAEISHSPRLGPTMAAWVEKNEAALRRHSALQTRGWGTAAEEESSSAVQRQPVAADAVNKAPDSSLAVQHDGTPPSEQELADMDKKAAVGMADVLAHGERYASTATDPRSWLTVAHGGQLSPNPGGADYPPGVLDEGEAYTRHTYTEGKQSFPVIQTARGVYTYPSAAVQQVIVSGKDARAALLAADAAAAAAQTAEVAEINADLRNYSAQQLADSTPSNGGWADSRQPEAPLIDLRQKVASNAAVVNNLFSADGWSAVGSVLKDGLRNAGGINGPGFDVRSGPVITTTAKQQDAAVDTLLSVLALFEHELALLSVIVPVTEGAANKIVMNSGGDRLIETMGPARINNSSEFDAIISDLRVNNVEISFREGQFAYGPAPTGGRPGNIVFDPDSSLSAIKHEYGHFLNDQALGYPGQRYYYENPSARVATERAQYLGEIRTARELGDLNARRQLINDYLGERKYLVDTYYTNPYGPK